MPLKDVRVTYSLLTRLGEKRRKARKKLTKTKKKGIKKRRRPWSYLQAGERLAIQQICKQLSCGSSLEAEECGVRQQLSHGVFPGGCPASRRAGPWKTTLSFSLHHRVPPMEQTEREEGVQPADKNTSSLAQGLFLVPGGCAALCSVRHSFLACPGQGEAVPACPCSRGRAGTAGRLRAAPGEGKPGWGAQGDAGGQRPGLCPAQPCPAELERWKGRGKDLGNL